ncbi:hypothetical protein F8388_013530 [Cannabis sativa]|uniref:Uncharacterized protein n=1 Tax=Cannabis sativa TaxID=3483 RepID=A0A7J6G938_CANSA|nr:hypothetical protein F8388_013530 [Cannabis sativa]
MNDNIQLFAHNGLNLHNILVETEKCGSSFDELVTIPEQDDWLYNDGKFSIFFQIQSNFWFHLRRSKAIESSSSPSSMRLAISSKFIISEQNL